MQQQIMQYWRQLQARERFVLVIAGVFFACLLFFNLLWQPWHTAIDHMQTILPHKRVELVWMRQQAKAVSSGGITQQSSIKGSRQSLLSVIEQSAKSSGVRKAIQQMVPRQENREVSVVLEGVSFNKWLRWIDGLSKQYGVEIKQLSADREDKQPDIAEIRVTFERNR